jgi:hypothetical protein
MPAAKVDGTAEEVPERQRYYLTYLLRQPIGSEFSLQFCTLLIDGTT